MGTEKRICKHCGKEFDFRIALGNKKPNAGQFCSVECFNNSRRIEKVCPTCGRTFKIMKCYGENSKYRTQKYCSQECAGVANHKVTLKCTVCGKEYFVKPHKSKTSKYCSAKCRRVICDQILRQALEKSIEVRKQNSTKRRTLIECAICGKVFSRAPSGAHIKTCSRKCAGQYIGILLRKAAIYDKTRTTRTAWVHLRETVKARDGYHCTECGSSENLLVHHIIPWKKCKEDKEENLITLCRSCHGKIEYTRKALHKPFQRRMAEKFGSKL